MKSAPFQPSSRLSIEQSLDYVKERFAALFSDSSIDRDHVVLRVDAKNIVPLCSALKEDSTLQMDFLVSQTAVDWMDKNDSRFEIVYHLLSLKTLVRIRIKAWVAEHKPEVETLVPLWQSANFMEREVFDMYGIVFKGHPDLRRILMYDEFKGHPLRKDYPVQAKQPRVALRYPEVENTAQQMVRSELVGINRRNAKSSPEAR